MIIRKPYAFLIKNFRKIHIFLLLICAYLYYITISVRSFVKDFMELGTYNINLESISKYLNFFSFFSLVLIIVISVILIRLLKHKNKPWKLYLVLLFEYLLMFILFFIIVNFFNSYTGNLSSTTGIRAIRDLLFIISLFQYPVFLILIIRIIGVDLNKFNFKSDQEYLELDSDDREEVEINIDIDSESFKRTFRKFKRNVGYVYQEHRFLINLLFTGLFIFIIGYGYRYFFIIHKVYNQNDILKANNYSIKINDVYLTNKDGKGDILEKNRNFVVVSLSLKNNIQARKIDFNKFHVINGISDYTYTGDTYKLDFNDLGNAYSSYEIKRDETLNLILIYKVSNNLNINKFALYYQEINGYNDTFLRKIKINISDVSKIKTKDKRNIGEKLTIKQDSVNKNFTIDELNFVDSSNYSYQVCSSEGLCYLTTGQVIATQGTKIMKISFASVDLDGKDLIDFSSKYGKIKYKDSNGNEKVLNIESYLNTNYYGKYLYLKIPTDVESSSLIELVYTIRNNEYIYKLR